MVKSSFEFFEKLLVFNTLRYFIFAFIPFAIWYYFLKKKVQKHKIQSIFPSDKDYRREIFYSMITSVIFSLVAFVILTDPVRQYTLQYENFEERGIAYWFLSLGLAILIHDTFFYWTHRMMHHKKVFHLVHLVHHKSTNPSPWAAYAFHPIEGILEALAFVPIIFIVPYHITMLIAFMTFMIIYNVYGHLGFELYPKGFNKNFIGKWINTSINHNLHHEKVTGNYGLYFLFWDRWMGTIRDDYDSTFEENVEKRKRGN